MIAIYKMCTKTADWKQLRLYNECPRRFLQIVQ